MTDTTTAIVIAIFASTGFWAFVSSVYTHVTSRKEEARSDIDIIKKALLSVLYDKLYERSIRAIQIGTITAEDRENIRQLLKPYEALGGDGIIHDLTARVEELPLYIDQE